MAQLTLADIRALVRFRGDYQNVRKFPDASVDGEIQCAFGDFYELVDDAHEGWWDTQGQITTVANQQYIALPPDCWRLQAIDRSDGGEWVEMTQFGLHDRNRFGTSTGKPLGYRTSSRGIEMSPVPDGIYTLRVSYTPLAPLLRESQPREWYNGWEDYVVEKTLLALDKRERMPLADRLASLEKMEKSIRQSASERRQQEPEYLRLREFEDFDPYKDGLY